MSETGTSWPELYRQAVMESDRVLLPAPIEEAHDAIQRRSRELWYAGSPGQGNGVISTRRCIPRTAQEIKVRRCECCAGARGTPHQSGRLETSTRS